MASILRGSDNLDSADIVKDSTCESDIAPYNKGFKNQIINGSFDIWQRGANIVANITTGLYTADMWLATQFGAGGIQTISAKAANLPDKNARSLKSLQTTACANRIVQILDNDNSYKVRGNKLTISFWYKAKGTFSAKFNERTDQQTLSMHFSTTSPELVGSTIGSFTGIADETWRYGQFTTNTTNSNGFFHLIFEQAAGINNYFEITEVQLEEGSAATPFENRPQGLELSLCQRYFYNFNNYDALYRIPPATKLTTIPFPVSMRTTPTILSYILDKDGIPQTVNSGATTIQAIKEAVLFIVEGTYTFVDVTYFTASAEL